MKTGSFVVGAAIGAVAALFMRKKFSKSGICACDAVSENPALKEAENAVDTLRNSVEILKKELKNRIESEQTYAAKYEDLVDQVEKKTAEIETLKNICDVQNGCYQKLEKELDEVKSSNQ